MRFLTEGGTSVDKENGSTDFMAGLLIGSAIGRHNGFNPCSSLRQRSQSHANG